MKELQTALGVNVPLGTRSILYICALSGDKLIVRKELFFKNRMDGLNTYANIHNPESQLIVGDTYDELIKNMHILHKRMKSPEWIEMLKDSI